MTNLILNGNEAMIQGMVIELVVAGIRNYPLVPCPNFVPVRFFSATCCLRAAPPMQCSIKELDVDFWLFDTFDLRGGRVETMVSRVKTQAFCVVIFFHRLI